MQACMTKAKEMQKVVYAYVHIYAHMCIQITIKVKNLIMNLGVEILEEWSGGC